MQTQDVVLTGSALQFSTRFDELQPFQHVVSFRIDRVLVPARLDTIPFFFLSIPELNNTHTVSVASNVPAYCALYPRRIIGSTMTLDVHSSYVPKQAFSYQTKLTMALLDPTGAPVPTQEGDTFTVHATMTYKEHAAYGY